ncbi:MAG: hypothetical protein LBI41_00280 [Lactobacillales bacterium]|jgi:hypothetical protein|nr:hypothetical protein [Lactobacillales bacterium]
MEMQEEVWQKKITTDVEFRQALLKDPKPAIEKLTGKKLPEDLKIKFVEKDLGETEKNSSDTKIFVLPKLHSSGEELNLDDLENVAGGGTATALFFLKLFFG